jgi:hypothetical protein
MFLVRLNIHNLYQQNITRLSGLDLERSRQVMDAREIDILHIIRTIIVSYSQSEISLPKILT